MTVRPGETQAVIPNLSDRDRAQLADRGLTDVQLAAQLVCLRRGTVPAKLTRACTIGDGIIALSQERMASLAELHATASSAGRIQHFVPASGAATRMLRDLLVDNAADTPAGKRFAQERNAFAFARELHNITESDDPIDVLRAVLGDEGLGLAQLPKALIPFHRYEGHTRTACHEHLCEALAYARDSRGRANVHFTVSAEHLAAFEAEVQHCRKRLEANGELYVEFSIQHPETDTVAVDDCNRLIRDEQGDIWFRPGGHGALLRNLSQLDGDIVVIKNVDNVCHAQYAADSRRATLVGLLVETQRRINEILTLAESHDNYRDALVSLMCNLFALPADDVADWSAQRARQELARPLRVCGVVRNEGQPGGGPFWVAGERGVRQQIVESAQIDVANSEQKAIFASSTHFNPVEIVCGLRDRNGDSFALQDFVDTSAAFVTQKSRNGIPLKALEHPGLWNGSMAGWNTLFVEIPASAFNPVKSVFDLLLPAHQPVG